jgi:hypothetical protein
MLFISPVQGTLVCTGPTPNLGEPVLPDSRHRQVVKGVVSQDRVTQIL